MNLQKLLEQNFLKKVDPVSISQIKKRFETGMSYLNTAKELFKNNPSLSQVAYTNLYNAVRIIGETFLLLNGYKATINQHHKTVIQTCQLLMDATDMETLFSRLDRMRKSRNAMDYDVDILDVSEAMIKQAIKDAEKFAHTIQIFIEEKDGQSKLKL